MTNISIPKRRDLLGMWRLISVEVPLKNGDVGRPFGKAPVGTIVYLANGSMSVHINGSDTASGRLRAYAGAWRINEGRVIHEVEVSFEPELRGERLEREAQLDGAHLVYRTVETQGPGRPVVVWQRVR